MTCREVEKLLDLFLDGELEARAMRGVALHVTRCPACEGILQGVERLQDLIAETFSDALAEVDFSRFWSRIAARAQTPRRSVLAALLGRTRELGAGLGLTVAAAAVAGLAIGILLWSGGPRWQAGARINNQVRIDTLRSEAPSVAVLSEPASNTTVIWVVDDGETR